MSENAIHSISIAASKTDHGAELAILTSGDYTYIRANGQAIIIKYIGSGGKLVIPDRLDVYPVVAIGNNAFGCHSR